MSHSQVRATAPKHSFHQLPSCIGDTCATTFPRQVRVGSVWFSLVEFIDLPPKSLCLAVASMALDFGMTAIGLIITLLTGFATIQAMVDPLTQSTSPSDFWGRRWNLTIHDSFKVGQRVLQHLDGRSGAYSYTLVASEASTCLSDHSMYRKVGLRWERLWRRGSFTNMYCR